MGRDHRYPGTGLAQVERARIEDKRLVLMFVVWDASRE
jgi:hypothetical protein